MDEQERQKKVLLGKEKLAAFRKKKLKRKKKKRDEDGLDLGSESEASSVIDMTDLGSLSDVSDSSYSAEGEDMNDFEDGERITPETMEKARRELRKSHDRITELEETLLGKQTLLDSLLCENEALKTRAETKSSENLKIVRSGSEVQTAVIDVSCLHTLEECKAKIDECQAAIRQRDDLIGQLNENLRETTENRDSLQADYQRQAEQLAEQVQVLQDQLKQTGSWLQQHSGGHGISAEALVEAKNELLALQQVNKQKDGQILQLQAAVQERDQTITHIVDKYNGSAANFEKMKKAYIHLQNEAMVLKQEKSSTSVGKLQLEVSNLKQSYSDALLHISQLAQVKVKYEVLEVENEKLKCVNEELLKKESGSTEVVKQLMADVESLQRGGAQRMTVESPKGDIQREIDRLRAELEESHGQQIVQLKSELDGQHRMEVDRANRELTQLRTDKQQLTRQVTEWQKMYMTLSETGASGADLHLEIHALRTENSMYKDKISEMDSQLSLVLGDKDNLQKELDGMSKSSSGASNNGNQDLQTLTNQCSRYKDELLELANEIQSLHSERQSVLKELEDAQTKAQELEVLQGKTRTYESMVATLEQKLAGAQRERDSYTSELDALKGKLTSIQKTMDLLSAELESTAQHLESTESQLALSQNANTELKELNSKTQAKLSETGKVLQETSGKLDGATRRVLELEANAQNTQKEIESLKSNHEQDLKVVQNQFELKLKIDSEESNAELQRTKLELETLKASQTGSCEEVVAVQEKYQCEIDRLKSEYTQYIQQMQANYEAQVRNAYEQWKSAQETQIQQVHEQYSQQVVTLQGQYTEAQNSRVRELEEQHQAVIRQMREKQDTEVMQVMALGEQNVEGLKRELETVHGERRSETGEIRPEVVGKLQHQHNEELQRLQTQHSQEISRLKAYCDSLAEKLGTETRQTVTSSSDGEHVTGERGGHQEHHVYHHHHSQTTHVLHKKVVQSSSHMVENRTIVSEVQQQPSSMSSTSASPAMLSPSDHQTDSEVSLQSLPHEDTEMIGPGLLTQTVSDQSIPETGYTDTSDQSIPETGCTEPSDLISMLKHRVQELEKQNSALEEVNQTLSTELVSSQKDSSLDARESSSGSSTTLHEVQLKDYQLSVLETENDKLTGRIHELTALLAKQGKQPVEGEVSEEAHNPEGLVRTAEQVEKVESVDAEVDHSTSLTTVPDAEVSMMTEASDLYVSASESPTKAESQRIQDLQETIRGLETSKQRLAAHLHNAELSAKDHEGKLLSVIEDLKDKNVLLTQQINQGEKDLKDKLKSVQTSKASLETEIFYKDLEISKLVSEREGLMEKESDTKEAVVSKDEVDAGGGELGSTEAEVTTDLKREVEQLRADVVVKQEEAESYRMQYEAQQADYERLKMEMAGENFEVERLHSEVDSLKDRPEGKPSQTPQYRANSPQEESVEALREKITRLEEDKVQLLNRLDERETDVGELQAELDSHKTEIGELMREAMEVDEDRVKQVLTLVHKEVTGQGVGDEHTQKPGMATDQCPVSGEVAVVQTGPDEDDEVVQATQPDGRALEQSGAATEQQQLKVDKDDTDKQNQSELDESVERTLEELQQLRSEYDAVRSELEKACSELAQKEQLFQSQTENVDICMSDLNSKINKLEESNKELKEKLETAEGELESKQQHCGELMERQTETLQKYEKLEKEMQQSTCKLQQVEAENKAIQNQKSDLEKEMKETKQLLEDVTSQQVSGKEELETQTEEMNQLKLEIGRLQTECESMSKEKETLVENLAKEKENLAENNEEYKKELARVEGEIESKIVEIDELAQGNSSLKTDLQRLSTEREEMDKLHSQQLQALKDDHARLVTNYEGLLQSMSSEKGDIVAEFEQMREMVDEKQQLVNEMQEETALLRLANQDLLQEQEQQSERLTQEVEAKQEVTKTIERLQRDNEEMRLNMEDLRGMEEKAGQFEKEKECLVVENESLQSMVRGQGETIVELKEAVTGLKGEVGGLKRRCGELEAEAEEVESTRKVEAEEKAKESEEHLMKVQGEMDQVKAELEKTKSILAEKQESLTEKDAILESLEKMVREKGAEIDDLNRSLERVEVKSESDMDVLRGQLDGSKQSIEELQVQIDTLQTQNTHKDKQISDINKQKHNLETNLENLSAEKEQLSSSMDLLKEEKDAKDAGVASSQEQIVSLTSAKRDLEDQLDQVRTELSSVCNEREVMAKTLQTNTEKFNEDSSALKIQLAEAEHAHVTSKSEMSLLSEKLDGSAQSIELLKVEIGNLQNEKDQKEHHIKELREELGKLAGESEALKCENGELVCERSKLEEERETISVSLQTSSAEVVRLRSVSNSMEETTHLLNTQMEGLNSEREQVQGALEDNIRQLNQTNQALREEISQVNKLHVASQGDLSLLEEKIGESRQSIEELEVDLGRVEREKQAQETELMEVRLERQRVEEDCLRLQRENEDLAGEVRVVREERERTRVEVRASGEEIRVLQTHSHQLTGQIEVLTARLEEATSQKEGLLKSLEGVTSQKEGLLKSIESADQEKQDLTRRLHESTQALTQTEKSRQDLSAELDSVKTQNTALTARSDAELQKLSQDLGQLQKTVSQVEMEKTNLTASEGELKQRLESAKQSAEDEKMRLEKEREDLKESLTQENTQAKHELEEMAELKLKLQESVQHLTQEKEKLTEKFDIEEEKLSSVITELRAEIMGLRTNIEEINRQSSLQLEKVVQSSDQVNEEKGQLENLVQSLQEERGVLDEKLSDVTNEKMELTERFETISRTNVDLEERVSQLRSDIDKVTGDLTESRESNAKLTEEMAGLTSVIGRLEGAKGELEESIEKVTAEKEGVSEELTKVKVTKGNLEKHIDAMRGTISEQSTEIERRDGELSEVKGQVEGLKVKLCESEATVGDRDKAIEVLRAIESRVTDLEARNEQFAEEKTELERSNSELEQRLMSAQSESEDKTKALSTLSEEREETDRQKVKVMGENKVLRNLVDELKKQRADVQDEVERLKSEESLLRAHSEKQEASLKSDIQGLKFEADLLRSEKIQVESLLETGETALTGFKAEKERLSDEMKSLRLKLDSLEGNAQKSQHDLEEMSEALKKSESESKRHEDKVGELSAERSERDRRVAELEERLSAEKTQICSELSSTMKEFITLKSDLEGLKTKLSEKSEQVKLLKREKVKVEEELGEARDSVGLLEEESRDKGRMNEEYRERVEGLQSELEGLRSELVQERQGKQEAEEKGRTDVESIQRELERLQTENTQMVRKSAEVAQELETYKRRLEAEVMEHKTSKMRVEDLTSRLESVLTDKAEIEAGKKSLEQANEVVHHQMETLHRDLEKMRTDTNLAHREKQFSEREREEIQASLDRLLHEHGVVTMEKEELTRSNKSLKDEVTTVTEALKAVEREKEGSVEQMRLLCSDKESLSSLTEEYQKEAARLRQEVNEARQKLTTATIEQDRLRSENLSLEAQRDGLQEKYSSCECERRHLVERCGGLESEVRVLRGAQRGEDAGKLRRELEEMRQTHSHALYDLQKQIKNQTNSSGQLEKEKKRLQERNTEIQRECEGLKRGREEAHRDYMKMSHECDKNRQEVQTKERECIDLRSRVIQLETEARHTKLVSQEVPVTTAADRGDITAEELDQREASHALQIGELRSEITSLRQEVNEAREQNQLMEASVENVKYERDRLKQQLSDLSLSLREGEDPDVSALHAREVSALRRSLDTVKSEREAMKTTFEEDLARLSGQVEEKENERRQLEEAVEDLKNQSEELMLRHSTPLTQSEHGDSSHSPTDSPAKPRPQPPTDRPHHFMQDLGLIQPDHAFQVLTSMQPQGQVDRFEEEPSDRLEAEPGVIDRFEAESSDRLQAEPIVIDPLEAEPLDSLEAEPKMIDRQNPVQSPVKREGVVAMGIFSDSCQFDNEENLQLRLGLGERKERERQEEKKVLEGSGQTDSRSVEELINRYEREISEMREQFEVELKVTEFNVSETYKLQQHQIRAQVQADFEDEYTIKYKELENEFDQRMKLLKKEHDSNLIKELQKMKKEFKENYSENRDEGSVGSHDSHVTGNQVTDETVQLTRKLERAEEAKISLMEQLDLHMNLETDLQEELLTLTKEKDRLAGENTKLGERLEFYTQTGTVESASEFSRDEWRVSYNAQFGGAGDVRGQTKVKKTEGKGESNLNDIGDGSLPTSQEVPPSLVAEALHLVDGGLQLDSGDENELRNQVDALVSENEALKVKLKDQSLGVDESIREEALEMQAKYQMLMQEKESLLQHLHRMGVSLSDLSLRHNPQGGKTEGGEERCVEVSQSVEVTQDTMEDDFMDWKLKYEVVERENQTLKSQIEEETQAVQPVHTGHQVHSPSTVRVHSPSNIQQGSDRVASPLSANTHYVITNGEYKNRHSALVEQNEMLRAHLGARGLFVDRSLEGDTLDMHLQLVTLASENEQLQQHLQDYDTGHLQGGEMGQMLDGQMSGSVITTTPTSANQGSSGAVNWRIMYEKLCKEHEDLRQRLEKDGEKDEIKDEIKDEKEVERMVKVEDVELQLQSAMEESGAESSTDHADQKHKEEEAKVTVSAKVTARDTPQVKQLEREVASLKEELQSNKSKAKKDLTKIKAKLAASNRELEKMRTKLLAYESHESVGSTVSNASDSSAPEDGGFVVVGRGKSDVPRAGQEVVTQSTETVIKETVSTQQVTVSKQFSEETLTKTATHLTSENSELVEINKKQEVLLAELQSEKQTLLQEIERLNEKLTKNRPSVAESVEKDTHNQDADHSDLEGDLKAALASVKREVGVVSEQLSSLQKSSRQREAELVERCASLEADLQDASQRLTSLTGELERSRSKYSEDRDWHEAENLNLQDQIEQLINDKKSLLTQLKDQQRARDRLEGELEARLGESVKEADQLRQQVAEVKGQNIKTAEQLVSLEEQYSEREETVSKLRAQVERHSVSQQASTRAVSNSVSTGVETVWHGGSAGSGAFSSSGGVLCCEENSVLHDQGMSSLHGDPGPPPQTATTSSSGGGMLYHTQPSNSLPSTLSTVSNQVPTQCVDYSDSRVTQTHMSLQETDGKNADYKGNGETIDGKPEAVFHPIQAPHDEDVASEDRRLTYSELVEECKELRLHYENIASQNSQLMVQLESMEEELTDTKFQLSCREEGSGGVSGQEVSGGVSGKETGGGVSMKEHVGGIGDSVVQVAYQTEEVYCDSLEGESRSDSSFSMSGVVNISVTDIAGSVENDIGRVVDVQTVSPSGKLSKGQDQTAKSSPEKTLRSKGFVSSTPKPQAGSKARETKKSRSQNVKEMPSGRLTPRAGKLSKAVSEAELSADLLKKERDKLLRENRQLKEKVNQMSRASNELSSLRTRYDRLNKDKRDLQARYDRDVSRKSPGVGSMRKKSEADELKRLKAEKTRLEKDMKELKSQHLAKSKENTELLNLIHHRGQIPYNQDVTQLRIEYEILLDEKKQMCDRFEAEKSGLAGELEDLQNQLELVELERDSALQVGLAASNGDCEEQDTEKSLRKHLLKLSERVRQMEQEKACIEESVEQQRDSRLQAVSQLRSERLQLQQKVNDLNSKTEVLQGQVRDLTSQLRLAELEKGEIKSELEEQMSRLEQENHENNHELASVIQASEHPSSSQQVSTLTPSSSSDHITVQIPPLMSYSQPPQHSTSPFSVKASHSSHSPRSVGSASSMHNYCSLLEGLTFSEILTQYEILLQEKKTICSKLENTEEALKESKLREEELAHVEEERDSYRIQCELLMDEKKELSAHTEGEMEMRNKIRAMTEQMLEMRRENQVLQIRTETLRRTLSQEPIEEECFESEEAELQRKQLQELQHKVKELVIQLEKSEQDLEISEANANQEAQQSFLKFEDQLKDERSRLSNLNEELEDSKFRLDEVKIQLDSVEEEKVQALGQVEVYREKVGEMDREMESLRAENDKLKQGMADKERQIADAMQELQDALDDCLTGKQAQWNEIQTLKAKIKHTESQPEAGGQEEKSKDEDRMTELQEENRSLQQDLSVMRQENQQYTEQVLQLVSGVTMLTSDNDTLKQEKARLETGLATLQKHATDVSDQIQGINEEYSKLQEDRALLTKTNETLVQRVKQLEEDVQKSRTENGELNSSKEDAMTEKEENELNTSSIEDRRTLEEALKTSTALVDEWKAKCFTLEEHVQQLKEALDETAKQSNTEKELFDRERADLKSQVDSLESDLESMKAERLKDQSEASQGPSKVSRQSEVYNKQSVRREGEMSSELQAESLQAELSQVRRDSELVQMEKEALQKFVTEAEIRKIGLEEENDSLTSSLQRLKLDYKSKLEESMKHQEELEAERTAREEEVKRLSELLSREEKPSLPVEKSSTPRLSEPAVCCEELDLSVVASNNNTDCRECGKFQQKCEEMCREIEKLNEICNRGSFISEVETVDVGADLILSVLQEENVCLFRQKTELENALMSANADKHELETQQKACEDKHQKELESLERNVGDYQSLCDTVSKTKERLERELLRQREEYEGNLSKLRSEKLEKFVEDAGRLDEFVEEMRGSERKVGELRDELRSVEEEKGLLQLKVGHLLRECKLYERHVKDLEREVGVQSSQIQEAAQEHKETIRMLAEMRMDQEVNKQQQRGEFSRIEGEIKRLETEIHSNRSTPRAMSVVSAPPGGKPRAGSVLSCGEEEGGKGWSECGGEVEGERALSLKHFQMIDEINSLQRDLQQARGIVNSTNFENKTLKEALEKERARHSVVSSANGEVSPVMTDSYAEMHRQKTSVVDTPKTTSHRSSISSVDYNDIPIEMISLKEKTLSLQTENHKLTKENEGLRLHIHKLEKLVEEYEVCIQAGGVKAGDAERMLSQQVGLLRQQRDDLLRRVEEMKRVSVDHQVALEEKSRVEELLRRERDLVRERTHEKEKVEIELLRERLALERQIREQHRRDEHRQGLEREIYRLRQGGGEEVRGETKGGQSEITSPQGGSNGRQDETVSLTSPHGQDESKGCTESEGNSPQGTNRELVQNTDTKSTQVSQVTQNNSIKTSPHVVSSSTNSVTTPVRNGDRAGNTETGDSSRLSGYSGSSCHGRRQSGSHRSRHSLGGASRSGGSRARKLTLDCGCVADLDTMKMYAECNYHVAVERLRTDLKRVEGQFKTRGK